MAWTTGDTPMFTRNVEGSLETDRYQGIYLQINPESAPSRQPNANQGDDDDDDDDEVVEITLIPAGTQEENSERRQGLI